MDYQSTRNDQHSSDSCSFTSDDDGIEQNDSWDKFEGLPPIPGFLSNVVVVFRPNLCEGFEKAEGDVAVVKKEEKDFTTEVCRYLSQNGVQNVQAVSNFVDYIGPVGEELITKQDELGIEVAFSTKQLQKYNVTDVTVILLFASNGRWQQQRMYELVEDSFFASRMGVIILGNTGVMEKFAEPKWGEFIQYIRRKNAVKNNLEIVCRTHRLVNRRIASAEDLREQSPFGGCANFCGKMDCGHVCPYLCHPIDPQHKSESYRCKQKCQRECISGHKCKEICWKNCGKCCYVVTVQYSCEHFKEKEKQMFCYQQPKVLCTALVNKRLDCGHFAMVSCSLEVEGSGYKCQQLLGGLLPCGHGYAFRCFENLPKNIVCKVPRLKTFECGHSVVLICSNLGKPLKCGKLCNAKLECGHKCERLCHLDDRKHENVICQKPCNRLCDRGVHFCSRRGHPCSEPCGPCMEEYSYHLQICGHALKITCSDQDPDEDTYFCTQPCQRQHAFCHHPCKKLCGEDCGPCDANVTKTVLNCPRDHTVETKCQERQPTKCTKMDFPLVKSYCGHKIKVPCFEFDKVTAIDLSERCKFQCTARFEQENECGHKCRGTCKDCFQGRFHMRCQEPCGKVLICGHSCTSPCGMVCPPCRYECMNYCEHARCEYECGVPCVRDCEKPCSYKCTHSECSKLCHEVCNKKICYEPCPKILECGHPCVGFCGEDCPPYCRICTPKELIRGIFSGENEVGSDDRFIFLKDCGHCVENDAMENWIKVESEEILPIRCPICSTRISWLRRYSSAMNKNFDLINSVRIKIFGKKDEIVNIIKDLVEAVNKHILSRECQVYFPTYLDNFLIEVTLPLFTAPKKETDLQSMSLERARFLKWICEEWTNVEKILAEFQVKLVPEKFDNFKNYWTLYLEDMAEDRIWPMHPNEIRALTVERQRLDDVVELYSRMSIHQSERIKDLMTSNEGTRLFRAADDILQQCIPYSKNLREEFYQCLRQLDGVLQCTIDLTERERVQIVTAFGEGSGRWFKCENGHPYVVTECGGATELGKCFECGAQIGGQNHVLVENNYLAKEMDGADAPLYPTALNRNY